MKDRLKGLQRTLEEALAEVDKIIEELEGGNGVTSSAGVPTPAASGQATPAKQRYKGLSIRWSLMWFLSEHPMQRLTEKQITKALVEGGISKTGHDVRLVIADMVAKDELDAAPEGFMLNHVSQVKWAAIKGGSKFQDHLLGLGMLKTN